MNKTSKKSEITKAKILQTSLKLFNQQGIEKTTLRQIAKLSKTALGNTYYYFRSKEDIIHYFYEESQKNIFTFADTILKQTNSFEERINRLLNAYFDYFSENKSLYQSLVSSVLSPQNPTSPFSTRSNRLRQNSIDIFRKMIEGSDLRLQPDLKEKVPLLCWFYYMGLFLFWSHDASPKHSRTQKLIVE